MALDPDLTKLLGDLRALHHHLRAETREKYRRINPFFEDLFEWKERGAFWTDSGKDITIYNSTSLVGDVEIGDHTWIGPFCSLDGTGRIVIGRYCSISLGCQILTHDTVKFALSGGALSYDYAPVSIGDRCFLGVHAVVLRGVRIGQQCVVGAGAVVTHDVPDRTVVAGVPARRIGSVEVKSDTDIALRYDHPEP
ncbi:MAG TPA: acyltransferase [Stellaceae bacterium]|nr:acyltransferase [Stellaceae bacterium]